MKNSKDAAERAHEVRLMPTVPEELGVLIKETQAVLNHRMDQALRPLGLTVPQYACLQNLHDAPGLTASELARRTFVSRQSVNVLLTGLAERGLVERAVEPGPRRQRAVGLTPAGAAALTEARGAVATVAETMAAPLSAERQTELRSALAKCRDALAAD